MAKETTEVRVCEMGHVCRRCGEYMYPQMMVVVFDEQGRVMGFQHLRCEAKKEKES